MAGWPDSSVNMSAELDAFRCSKEFTASLSRTLVEVEREQNGCQSRTWSNLLLRAKSWVTVSVAWRCQSSQPVE